VLIPSNMVTYTHLIILVSEFKPNFIDKYFIDNIINKTIDRLFFKSDRIE